MKYFGILTLSFTGLVMYMKVNSLLLLIQDGQLQVTMVFLKRLSWSWSHIALIGDV